MGYALAVGSSVGIHKAEPIMIRTLTRVWQRLAAPQQTLPITPGVYVVANSPRQARCLWRLAVEAEVSASLMRPVSHRAPEPFQTHLLTPPPSPD
jgi:hypothetical protein